MTCPWSAGSSPRANSVALSRRFGTSRAPGLPEGVQVSAGIRVTARVDLEVPEQDWSGVPGRIDRVKFLLVSLGREPDRPVEVLVLAARREGHSFLSRTIEVSDVCFAVRARGRRIVPVGPDLLFYTNPIRLRVRASGPEGA